MSIQVQTSDGTIKECQEKGKNFGDLIDDFEGSGKFADFQFLYNENLLSNIAKNTKLAAICQVKGGKITIQRKQAQNSTILPATGFQPIPSNNIQIDQTSIPQSIPPVDVWATSAMQKLNETSQIKLGFNQMSINPTSKISTGAKPDTVGTSSTIFKPAPTFGVGPNAPTSGVGPYAPTSGVGPNAPTSGVGSYAPTSGVGPYAPTSVPNPFAPTSVPNPFAPTSVPSPFVPTTVPSPFVQTSVPVPGGFPMGGPKIPPKEFTPNPVQLAQNQSLRKEVTYRSQINDEIKLISDYKVKITDKGNKVELESEKYDMKAIFLEENANEKIQAEIRKQLTKDAYPQDIKLVVKCLVGEQNQSTKVVFKKNYDGVAIQWATGLITLFDFDLAI